MPRTETVKAADVTELSEGTIKALDADVETRDQRASELVMIDAEYSDNLPYDATRLENEVQFYLSQSAEAMLQAGKRLLLLKEHEGHGNFLNSLERIGLERRTATNFMRAATKFSSPNGKSISYLGKTKLFALMSEPDDEIDALAEGGTLAGKTLDEMDKMSVSELKKALRDAKQEKEATEKIIAQKDKKINELDRDAQRIALLEGDDLHKELEADIYKSTQLLTAELRVFAKAVENITFKGTLLPEALRGRPYQALELVRAQMRDIELQFEVTKIMTGEGDFGEDGELAWGQDFLKKED